MADPKSVLSAAQTILLVDWPSPAVPRALIAAGFTVFGYSPDRYSAAEVVADRPNDVDAKSVFPPRSDGDAGFLVFRPLKDRPSRVDLVNVYRPPHEIPGIVAHHVLPMGAKALWLQAPNSSNAARRFATEYGLAYVEGSDIAEVARSLGTR
jgi:predicted CoA-binding protein